MATTARLMTVGGPAGMAATALAGWDDDRLVALLEARPDLASPAPRSLGALAERVAGVTSVRVALGRLDRGALQVLEAMGLLAPPVPVERLAAVLAPGVGPADLDRPLAVLERFALVFRDGKGLTPNPGLAPLLRRAGLGPPLDGVLRAQPASQLAEVCRRLGVKPGANKAASVAAIAALVGDPASVRRSLEAAPAGTVELAEKAARGSEVVVHAGAYAPDDRTPAGWLMRRGLLAVADWYHLVMPGEVGLALRVAADVMKALEGWAEQPPKRLKDGGVGVRDLRRTAKAIERTERDT
ncbi:MAG: hypothetical protein ACRD12_21510, partial [Acidimicrobiales bacterium]